MFLACNRCVICGSFMYSDNLKNKTASSFASKMHLFRINRGIANQDKQTMVTHRQVWRTKERNALLQRRGGFLGGAGITAHCCEAGVQVECIFMG